MVAQFSRCSGRANLRGASVLPSSLSSPSSRRGRAVFLHRLAQARSSSNGDSYLDMWRKSMERERRSQELGRISDRPNDGGDGTTAASSLEAKTERFNQLLQVPTEERDRIQRLQVIDRAAAAIAAARAFLKESPPAKKPPTAATRSSAYDRSNTPSGATIAAPDDQLGSGGPLPDQSNAHQERTPGPDFWSWSPPSINNRSSSDIGISHVQAQNIDPNSYRQVQLMEKDSTFEYLAIPLESSLFESTHSPSLPPFQTLVKNNEKEKKTTTDMLSAVEQNNLDVFFSRHAAEAAEALGRNEESLLQGVNPDGSKWWKETGVEEREDGVVCKWTLLRGASADGTVEWQDKFWEAADDFDYKELGSEKTGRDASGNIWREYWKESMWQDLGTGLLHVEKTADKWGKNGDGQEWQEQWWEHYNTSGEAEKWAHKWCCIDPNTPLEAGHAHVWHERWGEKYDGKGGSMKYTDKWAERCEGDGWSKWGDKWDEHFDSYGHGAKQGETWWKGQDGECWNRTWGEQHSATGWVHKYGKSSSGEHWDTHVQEDTWYERHPHYGFDHCFKNSVQLRAVRKPLDIM